MKYAMRYEKYQVMYELEETFWWFDGIREISEAVLRPHVPRDKKLAIVDLGCGTGLNINWLSGLNSTRPVLGLDFSYDALAFCRKRDLRFLCQGSVTDMPLRSDFFDLVTSFDVLPHIPRGEPADKSFAECYRILKPGGLYVVRTSAYQWLKSSHDDDLHAPYRYTAPELAGSLRRAGFTVERVTYANTLAFPFAVAARLAKKIGLGSGSDVKPLPNGLHWVEKMFRSLLGWEAGYLADKGRRFPFGLSVFAIARK